MLTIYKTTEQGLEQLKSMANGTWVKVVDPTPEEIQQLVTWGIDADYINYSLTLMKCRAWNGMRITPSS